MIRTLRHRIVLCSQKDVVLEGGQLSLTREARSAMWAAIEDRRGSTFMPDGQTIRPSRTVRTHRIIIRHRPNLQVSAYAWIYEAKRLSAPRWFKILTARVSESDETQIFDCRLVEQSDDILQPDTGPVVGLPAGVRL